MQKSKMPPDRALWQMQASTFKESRRIAALGIEPVGPWQNQISPRRSPGRTWVTQPESEEKQGETIAMLKQEQKKMLADDDKDDDDLVWSLRTGWAQQKSMPKPRQKSMPKQNANQHLEEVKKQLLEVGKDEVEKQLGDVEDRISGWKMWKVGTAEGLKREWVEQQTECLKREKRRLEHKEQQLLEHNRQQLDVAASSSSSSSWMMPGGARKFGHPEASHQVIQGQNRSTNLPEDS
jgi:hypothetical protein